jgi:hypothetical protein
MGGFFPIGIGLSGFVGNLFELVTNLFSEELFQGFIVGKFDGVLLYDGSLLLSSRHSGDLQC